MKVSQSNGVARGVLPGWRQHTFLLVVFTTLCSAGLQFSASVVMQALRYQRQEIWAGQWWRLISGHFLHLSWAHWAMNIAALWVMMSLWGQRLPAYHIQIIYWGCVVGTGLSLLWWSPQLSWYVGFSGVLHGLLVGLLLLHWHRVGWSVEIVLLVGVWAKIGWEQALGPLPGSESLAGGPVIVDAHFFGALWGGALGLMLVLLDAPRNKKTL